MANDLKQNGHDSKKIPPKVTEPEIEKTPSFLDIELPNPFSGLASLLGLDEIFDGVKKPVLKAEGNTDGEPISDRKADLERREQPITVNVNLDKYFKRTKSKRDDSDNGSDGTSEKEGKAVRKQEPTEE